MSTLAEKLDLLFKAFLRPDGREFSYRQVEEGTNKAVTGAYVWKIRVGRAENPGYRTLQALARFFEVPVSYFFEEEVTEEDAKNLRLAVELRRDEVADLALRTSELDAQGRRAVSDMVEYVRKAQGLPSEFNGEEEE
jgi:transcriptional regulator with XRE-family HTH domain